MPLFMFVQTPLSRPRLTSDAIPTIFPSRNPIKISIRRSGKAKKNIEESLLPLATVTTDNKNITSSINSNFIFKLQPRIPFPQGVLQNESVNTSITIEDDENYQYNDDEDDVQIIEPSSPEESFDNLAIGQFEEIFIDASEDDYNGYLLFRKILLKKATVKLPKASWSMCWVSKAGRRYITFLQTVLTNDDNTPVTKRKVVIERSLNYKLYIGFIPVTKLDNILPTTPFKISSVNDIETLLVAFDNVDLCEGGPIMVKYPHAHIMDAELDLTTDRWRSKNCKTIVNGNNQCEACLELQKEISLLRINSQTCKSLKSRQILPKNYRKLRSRRMRLKKLCLELEGDVKSLRSKSVHLLNQTLMAQLSTMNFSSLQKQLIEECLRMNESPICFSDEWLFTCTVLYKCNPEAYSFMWKSNVFPLPSPDTIKKSENRLGDKVSLEVASVRNEVDPLVMY